MTTPISLLKEMVTAWGTQCPDWEPTCAACQAWKLFKTLNRVPTIDEVEPLMENPND